MYCLLISFFLYIKFLYADKCTWNNCPKYNHSLINVHIVPHTHDDLGWISTFDEYYHKGPFKQSLTNTGVKSILNTIIYELNKNDSRRFSYAELGYLKRWMNDYGEYGYETIKRFVKTGRLEIVGGGYVQPDEATTHYIELIDMYSYSLMWLNETFGECGRPKVAWNVDSFGHSKEHSNLLRQMGYDFHYFCRVHYKEHRFRLQNRSSLFNWHVSDDDDATLFSEHSFLFAHTVPPGFCWEGSHHQACHDQPIIEYENQGAVNIDGIRRLFIKYIFKRLKTQRHRHLLFTLGDDFTYAVADSYFTNIDKLIHHLNKEYSGIMNVFYSTPGCYLQALNELKNVTVGEKYGDFFPYAWNEHGYWTGFFTSKPGIKGLVRKTSSLLQLTRQLHGIALTTLSGNLSKYIEEIESAVALCISHDAITGSSRERVKEDFIYHLMKGWDAAEKILNAAMQSISNALKNNDAEIPRQIICRKINESECEFTRNHLKYFVTVHNANSANLNTLVRLPLYQYLVNSIEILDSSGNQVDYQILPVFNNDNQLNNSNIASNEICFMAEIDPLGYKTYFVLIKQNILSILKKYDENTMANPNSISNGLIKLIFDSEGYLSEFHDLTTQKTYQIKQEFLYYRGYLAYGATNGLPPSGVYIFRPVNNTVFNFTHVYDKLKLSIIDGKIVKEARQVIAPWVSQIIRLVPNKKIVEFEWTVGPISTKYSTSKEVITRYTVKGLKTNGVFFTDSNGRQLMKRVRNYYQQYYKNNDNESISKNYYPITNKVLISDYNTSMAILTDRAQGCSSLKDGQIEIMLHRRDLADDMFGWGEPLNETGHDGRGLVVRGKHWLILGNSQDVTRMHRSLAFEMYHSNWMTFSTYGSNEEYRKNFITKFSGLKVPLPPNVNLITLKQLNLNNILIRLEHIYQKNEDPVMSQAATVDLINLFPNYQISSILELNLAGSDYIESSNISKIILKPMEIKTYRLELKPNKHIKNAVSISINNISTPKLKIVENKKELNNFISDSTKNNYFILRHMVGIGYIQRDNIMIYLLICILSIWASLIFYILFKRSFKTNIFKKMFQYKNQSLSKHHHN